MSHKYSATANEFQTVGPTELKRRQENQTRCDEHMVQSVDGQRQFAAVDSDRQRQILRCTGRSLDQESVATLVHAFVTSRVDYCNTLLAAAPKVTTDKLQRVQQQQQQQQ